MRATSYKKKNEIVNRTINIYIYLWSLENWRRPFKIIIEAHLHRPGPLQTVFICSHPYMSISVSSKWHFTLVSALSASTLVYTSLSLSLARAHTHVHTYKHEHTNSLETECCDYVQVALTPLAQGVWTGYGR